MPPPSNVDANSPPIVFADGVWYDKITNEVSGRGTIFAYVQFPPETQEVLSGYTALEGENFTGPGVSPLPTAQASEQIAQATAVGATVVVEGPQGPIAVSPPRELPPGEDQVVIPLLMEDGTPTGLGVLWGKDPFTGDIGLLNNEPIKVPKAPPDLDAPIDTAELPGTDKLFFYDANGNFHTIDPLIPPPKLTDDAGVRIPPVNIAGTNYVEVLKSDGTVQLVQSAGVPTMDQQLATAFAAGELDVAAQIRDFIDQPKTLEQLEVRYLQAGDLAAAQAVFNFASQPTQTEAINNLLALMKSPADSAIISALAFGAREAPGDSFLSGFEEIIENITQAAMGQFGAAGATAVQSGAQLGGVQNITPEAISTVNTGQPLPITGPRTGALALQDQAASLPQAQATPGPAILQPSDDRFTAPAPITAQPSGGSIPSALGPIGTSNAEIVQPLGPGIPSSLTAPTLAGTPEGIVDQTANVFGREGIQDLILENTATNFPRINAALTGGTVAPAPITGVLEDRSIKAPSLTSLRNLAPSERELLFGTAEALGTSAEDFEAAILKATPGARATSFTARATPRNI